MKQSNYVIHDCETGGLEPKKNPITQYACIILDYKTLKEVDRYETFIQPYNDLVIDKEAIEYTQVRMSDLRSGITLETFIKTMKSFYGQHQGKGKIKEANRLVSVGHNIPFDHGFLEEAFDLEDEDYYEWVQPNFIDTYPLAKMTWGLKGDEKLTLTACCERAKLKITDAHGAMNDVEATADLFRWFIKKLRSGVKVNELDITGDRLRGSEFFEFRCGVK